MLIVSAPLPGYRQMTIDLSVNIQVSHCQDIGSRGTGEWRDG